MFTTKVHLYQGNVFERLDRLEAKVSILLDNMSRKNKMDQNDSKDSLEVELPLETRYRPVNKKANDDGERRSKRAARLIPVTLLM